MKIQSPYLSWWYCDNIICHPGMVALLTDAWNFLAAEEAEEERQAELRELEEEEGLDELGIPYLD